MPVHGGRRGHRRADQMGATAIALALIINATTLPTEAATPRLSAGAGDGVAAAPRSRYRNSGPNPRTKASPSAWSGADPFSTTITS